MDRCLKVTEADTIIFAFNGIYNYGIVKEGCGYLCSTIPVPAECQRKNCKGGSVTSDKLYPYLKVLTYGENVPYAVMVASRDPNVGVDISGSITLNY